MATKKEIRLYGDLVHQHRLTFRSILLEIFLGFLNKKRGVKESIYDENLYFSPPADHLRELPLKYLAIVNNKKVLELIRLDENTAKHIQKRGSVLVEFDPYEVVVKKDMKYIDGNFINIDDLDKRDDEQIDEKN
jgi:hypothetical protein